MFRTNQQSQKYCRMVAEGFEKNGVNVKVNSFLAINNSNSKQVIVKAFDDEESGIHFHYPISMNIPILKNVIRFFQSFFSSLLFFIRNKDAILVCDPMSATISYSALLSARLLHRRSLALVTDIPQFHTRNVGKKMPVYDRVRAKLISRFDCYLLLTEAMNEIINPLGKPHITIEGFSDAKMSEQENEFGKKYIPRVVMYTGAVVKHYGLEKLVQAFQIANIPNAELIIYGGGSYVKELKEICDGNPKIKYGGVLLNNQIIDEQAKATLLVNPRPTDNEFVKYSFPSKNLEYMSSGTPTLTTKLPGMPKEYYNYVFCFDDETPSKMGDTLKKILEISNEDLFAKGKIAKEWILSEKNNIRQIKRVIEMLNNKVDF